MKKIISYLIVGFLVLLPIKLNYCEECGHYHQNGVCIEKDCDCISGIPISPNGYKQFPDD